MTDAFPDLDTELTRLLNEADMDALRGRLPAIPDRALLPTLHKARLDRVHCDPALRRASADWLREAGMTRYAGLPLPGPDDPLPSADD